jgi:AcrR family transcriptional regulator
MEVGPAGLKLDAVAREVGVSRQAVLHHFGSREGLMRAVVEEAWRGLFADLTSLSDQTALSPEAFVDQVDHVVRAQGNARLGAWLLLSGTGLPEDVFRGALDHLPERFESLGVDAERGRYLLLLIGAALFGDALFGLRLRQAVGLEDDDESRAAFRAMLVAVLQAAQGRAAESA